MTLDTDTVRGAPGATAAVPLLSVRNIEVVYDDVILVLRGLSLEVPRGAIVALLGANGAGKSTTLKAISGLLKTEDGEVTRGEIVFGGERIDGVDPDKIVRSVVDLPAPFEPMRVTISPSSTLRVTPRRAWIAP